MQKLFDDLRNEIEGDVYNNAIMRSIYSVDASIYELKPLGIVLPKSEDDLIKTLKIAARYHIPVTARGAATGITGSCLGEGLIIDTSTYMNRILKINLQEEYAICEPGVVQDRLNELLSPSGYRLGPDTSTGNRATIGGMMANNSAGARSLTYGCMVDHVLEIDLALAGGEVITFGPVTNEEWKEKRQQPDREGIIYNEVYRIKNTYLEDINTYFPKIPRHVSGYNLDRLSAPQLNLCQLITGSEGTLGIATKIKVRISKKPGITGACALHLDEMIPALRFIETMLAHNPIALEMIDDKILDAARKSPNIKTKLNWLKGNPKAVFVAEFSSTDQKNLNKKIEAFAEEMKQKGIGYAQTILNDSNQLAQVWEVRKAGLGLLLSKRDYSRAIAFVEDLSIAPEKLADFLEEFCAYIKSIGKEAGIYGHIGSGCMHIRPYIDLRKKEELHTMKKMLEDISSMVLSYGGAMSGEHGDGLVRSWLNEKMFGTSLYQAFKDLKTAFDPHHLMNPGKIVNGPPLENNLRLSPKSAINAIPTFLDFSREGGFELAADLCNGNGQCRKMEHVMCPSFQASGLEYDSTRARAQTLRSIIHGQLPLKELTGQGLYDVLDLCIECKGCKKECPSQVDMAKMKSEILYQYQEKHGYSWRNRFFGSLHRLNTFAAPFAKIFNVFSKTWLIKLLLNRLGITSQRDLPQLTSERFSVWFKKQQQPAKTKKVILFNDTYTEYNEPEIGKAAFKIFLELGFEVIIAHGYCCGRPLISKGFLQEAKTQATNNVEELSSLVNEDVKMVILEPSCASAFRDDYRGLIRNDILENLISNIFSFEEFLQMQLIDGKLPLTFKDNIQEIWVHTHCHQKALVGVEPTLKVLRGVKGFNVHEIEAGCCGMAGAFGYEKEHYSFSMKIGNLKLFPKIRRLQKQETIIASGMSCRSQIKDGTQRKALHLAEVILSQILEYDDLAPLSPALPGAQAKAVPGRRTPKKISLLDD